jgi:hypothetical protein
MRPAAPELHPFRPRSYLLELVTEKGKGAEKAAPRRNRLQCLETEAGLAAHQPEAVAAVDRTRPGRPERDLRVLVAPGAHGIEHLARSTAVAAPAVAAGAVASTAIAAAGAIAAAATRATLRATGRTALGRRGESLLREEFLLRSGEDEVDSTVRTGENLIGVGHEGPSHKELPRRASTPRSAPATGLAATP